MSGEWQNHKNEEGLLQAYQPTPDTRSLVEHQSHSWRNRFDNEPSDTGMDQGPGKTDQ